MFWQLNLSNDKAIQAEKLALRLLKKQGLQLIIGNFACRTGEIDLIMLDGDTLVFIEVRFRSNRHFGSAPSTITSKKQLKIRKTAAYYLQKHPQHNHRTCRFDVVAVSGNDAAPKKSLEWIKNAF
ncbi:YraN family protein [Endozoicomonas sp. (ex Bugula neritina AB1)]|nr:YraN family protein [Endozoicomonas sp. (ex Bugula neritina AB1)]